MYDHQTPVPGITEAASKRKLRRPLFWSLDQFLNLCLLRVRQSLFCDCIPSDSSKPDHTIWSTLRSLFWVVLFFRCFGVQSHGNTCLHGAFGYSAWSTFILLLRTASQLVSPEIVNSTYPLYQCGVLSPSQWPGPVENPPFRSHSIFVNTRIGPVKMNFNFRSSSEDIWIADAEHRGFILPSNFLTMVSMRADH